MENSSQVYNLVKLGNSIVNCEPTSKIIVPQRPRYQIYGHTSKTRDDKIKCVNSGEDRSHPHYIYRRGEQALKLAFNIK